MILADFSLRLKEPLRHTLKQRRPPDFILLNDCQSRIVTVPKQFYGRHDVLENNAAIYFEY